MKTTQKIDDTRRITQIPKDRVRSRQATVTRPGDCREAEHVETELTVRYIQLEFDFNRGADDSLTSDDDGPESVEDPLNSHRGEKTDG